MGKSRRKYEVNGEMERRVTAWKGRVRVPDRNQRQRVVDRVMQFLNFLNHGPHWESAET